MIASSLRDMAAITGRPVLFVRCIRSQSASGRRRRKSGRHSDFRPSRVRLARVPSTAHCTAREMAERVVPTKRIVSRAHLERWLQSETHNDVVEFVDHLNDAATGLKLTDTVHQSPVRTLHWDRRHTLS